MLPRLPQPLLDAFGVIVRPKLTDTRKALLCTILAEMTALLPQDNWFYGWMTRVLLERMTGYVAKNWAASAKSSWSTADAAACDIAECTHIIRDLLFRLVASHAGAGEAQLRPSAQMGCLLLVKEAILEAPELRAIGLDEEREALRIALDASLFPRLGGIDPDVRSAWSFSQQSRVDPRVPKRATFCGCR